MHTISQLVSSIMDEQGAALTITKMICRNTSIFFRDVPKLQLLLQIEQSYYSIQLALEKHFVASFVTDHWVTLFLGEE